MKIKLLILTVLLSVINVFSQNEFEPGYIILNNGSKTNCLIKNEDWKGGPTTFEYKIGENGEVKIETIANVKEFGSGETFKYIRTTLDVDQSTDVVNNLTDVRNPVMKEETLFLKTLLEGKASLYYTERENIKRYFYKSGDGEIEQLIYKRYMVTPQKMGSNDRYKQQLATNLSCSNLKENSFENLEYKRNKLINIFTNYNSCENSETIVYNKMATKAKFNLSLRPGVTFSSLSIDAAGKEKVQFDSNTGIRIGLEAEYVFPFNNGKWSLFLEPTYRGYKAEKEVIYTELLQKKTLVTAEYNSIELPIGARHYMFVNQDGAFFLDAAAVVDVSLLDSKIESSNESFYDMEVRTDVALGLGVGFRYKNEYSIEARYHTSRKVTSYQNIITSYNSFALIAGYNFL